MVIEVLYIAGCCNHPPALERVRQGLRLADLDEPIAEVSVSDEATARALQFPGSPTVRINGVDVESGIGTSLGLGVGCTPMGADCHPSTKLCAPFK